MITLTRNLKGYYFYIAFLLNFIFFIVYGFKLLIDEQNFSHFGFPNALGSSDLTGAIRMSQWYKEAGFLKFVSNYTNFPEGESIFSIYLISQFGTNLLMHLLNILSPKIVVLILQFIFSLISTLGVLMLSNQVLKNLRLSSLLAGASLLLNFNVVNLQAHINGLLWGMPLFGIYLLYSRLSAYKSSSFLFFGLIILLIFTDIYLFYSIVFIFVTYVVFKIYNSDKFLTLSNNFCKKLNLKILQNKNFARKTFIFLISLVFLYTLSIKEVRYLIASVYENSVFIPGKTLGSYFFEPTASSFFLVLSVIYFFFYLKRFSDADKLLYWIATSFFIFATNFGSFMGQNISPANILSPILPNLDHTQRFLPYAIFIFLLLFVKIASTSLRKHMGDLTKFREFAFIISTIILSLRLIYLGGTDHVSDHSLRYEIFRNVIPKSSSFLAIPQNVQGRDWIQQAYINRPMVNSLSTITREKIIREISVSSPTELRRYMQSKNTKFLVMPCNYKVIWETSRYAYHNFEKEFKLESLVIDRGYENGPFEVCLYRIVM